MTVIALPTTNFAENAGMTVSRVSAVSWCFARNIYRKGEQIKMIENEMTVSVPLEVVKASEIEPKEVKWLWYPYIPFGKVTLLQGDPGDGKSKLMLSVAALLSKGEPLPFTETEENEPVTIIYQTTEDDADDTVVPRFNSAGGNGENLIFIREDEKSLSFGDNRIREAIEMYHAKLLILDPMSSYIGEICSMNNANETRAEFNHLIAVAKDTGCAIVIIAHMNKMKDTNPLYKITLIHQLRHTVTLGTDIFGNIQRLDNTLGAFEERMAACAEQLENTRVQLENAKAEVQKPFPQEEELKTKSARLNELNAMLNLDKRENEIVDGERGEEEPQKSSADRER